MTDKPEVKDFPPYLDYPRPRVPMTNGDKIRAMTDEELEEFIESVNACNSCRRYGNLCFPSWDVAAWLKKEAKE